ncbi:MAG: Uma2 family endonuclease [Candidatus Rokubacteria bacterium]|nr:Uma2 family endonuclease [Candidatus Rokubacteria bacterium]
MAVTARRRRFTLDEYHWMGRVGIFHEDDRVELIEGEIIEMTPIGTVHAATVGRVNDLFSKRLGDRALVWIQNPLLLTRERSEPQPDILVLERRTDFYATALPEPADVRLLIEVADSSVSYDRRTKFPLYARAGVAEAWLIDLDGRRVELHRGPGARGYRDVISPGAGETFAPLAFPDVGVTVTDLLG